MLNKKIWVLSLSPESMSRLLISLHPDFYGWESSPVTTNFCFPCSVYGKVCSKSWVRSSKSILYIVFNRGRDNLLGAESIQRWHLTSIGNPIMEIRRSYDRLISIMGFPILVRWRLYIESGPWYGRAIDHSRWCFVLAPVFWPSIVKDLML